MISFFFYFLADCTFVTKSPAPFGIEMNRQSATDGCLPGRYNRIYIGFRSKYYLCHRWTGPLYVPQFEKKKKKRRCTQSIFDRRKRLVDKDGTANASCRAGRLSEGPSRPASLHVLPPSTEKELVLLLLPK